MEDLSPVDVSKLFFEVFKRVTQNTNNRNILAEAGIEVL